MSNFIDKGQYFAVKLVNWYALNHRKLPWRETKDPYKIWLSEVILQQTRIEQGLAYYQKFTANYPLLNDLANADEEAILKDWQGLGYYSRARNLHAAAREVRDYYNGQFPSDYASIRKLRGVGDYTAAAIASFAFNLPYAVVDGNVYRFLSRLFGVYTSIDSSQGKKQFQKMANQLLNSKAPATHNQAIMEFGATCCLPKKPKCDSCIFQNECVAYKSETVEQLPFKKHRTKQRKRFFHYLILETASMIFIKKRKEKEIWQNLYDFPLVETKENIHPKSLLRKKSIREILHTDNYTVQLFSENRKHILSHQIIHAKFYHISIPELNSVKSEKYLSINKKDLKKYPIPKLIENYLREETNLLSLS